MVSYISVRARLLLCATVGLAASMPTLAELTVGDYALQGKRRVSRTDYVFTYTATITNTGGGADQVRATLASDSPHTIVVDGELEFGTVPAGTVVQSQDTFAISQDRRFPFDWSDLTWAISVAPPDNKRIIDSAGGNFEFPGGLTLEVPPGAVMTPVAVELTPSVCGPIQPILDNRAISTKPNKTCLAAFTATPDGLTFDLPVVATLPMPPPGPGTYPILVDVDPAAATYSLLPTEIEYDGVSGTARVQLSGFSEKVIISVDLDPETEFGPEWAAANEEIETRCASCAGQLDNNGANLPFCENLDLFQTSCCLIPPAERSACYSTCFCCKEQRVKIVVSQVDFTSGDCQLLGSDIEVSYPDCPGSPTYIDSMDEASAECPEDLVWEIGVSPPSADILACEEVDFNATITGRSPEGDVVIAPTTLFPTWVSTNDTVARFVSPDGRIRGLSAGATVIEARISGRNATVGQAPVSVRSNIDSFSIDPSVVSLRIDEDVLLQAQVVGAPDAPTPPDPNDTEWSAVNPTIIEITPAGALASISGRNSGNTSLVATLDYACETVTATADVTVDCKAVDFSVSPDTLELIVGDDVLVSANAVDDQNNLLDTTGVTWQSSFETVVGVTNPVGPQTSVQALQPTVLGPVAVVATYDDGCQTKDASVLVTVGCVELELSVVEAIVEVDAFLPIAVTAVDRNGNPVVIDENQINWSSSDASIAAVIPSVGGLVTVIGIGAGQATIEASFDQGPCGVRRVTAQITVREETPDVSGTWIETVDEGGQTCDVIAGGTEEVTETWGGIEFPIAVSQIERNITISNSQFPGTDPYVGVIEPNPDPNFPWRFVATVSSNNTIDCRRFFDSAGQDIVFGQPACGGSVACQPTSCFETENIEGLLTPDISRFEGFSEHEFEATAVARVTNDDGSVTVFPNARVVCRGGSFFSGERP